MTLRKVLKNHRAFPTDESALKVVYLAIQDISKKWTVLIKDWKPALNRFVIAYDDLFPLRSFTLDTNYLTYPRNSLKAPQLYKVPFFTFTAE